VYGTARASHNTKQTAATVHCVCSECPVLPRLSKLHSAHLSRTQASEMGPTCLDSPALDESSLPAVDTAARWSTQRDSHHTAGHHYKQASTAAQPVSSFVTSLDPASAVRHAPGALHQHWQLSADTPKPPSRLPRDHLAVIPASTHTLVAGRSSRRRSRGEAD
jgi:hypothetical protein